MGGNKEVARTMLRRGGGGQVTALIIMKKI